jgi:hypothetical protein
MPRTMDNIGFYATQGFAPGHLTLTVSIEATPLTDVRPPLLSHHGNADRAAIVAECNALASAVRPGLDFTREIGLTLKHGLGDCLLLRDDAGLLEGFALFHDVPLVEGRSREEIRVLKLGLVEQSYRPRRCRHRRVAAGRCAVRSACKESTRWRSAHSLRVGRGCGGAIFA